jgi:hypothetical protein
MPQASGSSAESQDEGRKDPFAPKAPPPGAVTDDDEAEFGSNLAAQALAFAAQAPPMQGAAAKPSPAAAVKPAAAAAAAAPAAAKAPAPMAAKTPAPQHVEPSPSRSANPFATNPAAEEAGDDDEIFGGSNLAAAALAFASQAPPLRSSSSGSAAPQPVHAPSRVADEPPPLERSSRPVEAGACKVVESRDGIKVLWDVVFPSGGGVVVILTPKRSTPGELRPLPAHVSWRACDAIAPADTEAFAQVLSRAAREAQALPSATLKG